MPCFNSRAHVGRDGACWEFCDGIQSFNSRAHVGRDKTAARYLAYELVSIHAPTWGATLQQCLRQRRCCFNSRAHVGRDDRPRGRQAHFGVSIHAPTWGATCRTMARRLPWMFQFTRPRGARRCSAAAMPFRGRVSIHAPTWGATKLAQASGLPCCFNSRAHVGRDTHSRP